MEAGAFAAAGIAAYVYDKRTVGYSADGVGETSRSYNLLADDALAAVRMLREDVSIIDADYVGLWGHSEGAWVVSLAAARSKDIAFIITVGASGVEPIRQTAWAMENTLRHRGVTSPSFTEAMTRRALRLLVAARMFAEATHDPVPALEGLSQPVLAIWGGNERTAPPAESSQIFREAFARTDFQAYSMHFFAGANHDMRVSNDGFQTSSQVVPGYLDAMANWVFSVVNGSKLSAQTSGDPPQQERLSPNDVVQTRWSDSPWLHLAVVAYLIGVFAIHLGRVGYAVLRRRKRPQDGLESGGSADETGRRPFGGGNSRSDFLALMLALTGFAATFGFFAYFGYFVITHAVGVVVLGRPVTWLVLQILAAVTTALTIALLWTSWRGRQKGGWQNDTITSPRWVLSAGLVFVPFAVYWGLLGL